MKKFIVALLLALLAAPALPQPATQPTSDPTPQPVKNFRGKIGQNSTYAVDWEPASRAFINCMKTAREPVVKPDGLYVVVFVGLYKGDTQYDGKYTLLADEPYAVKTTGGSPAKFTSATEVEVSIKDANGQPRLITPQLQLFFPGRTTLPANFKCLRPGYTSDTTPETGQWTREYINLLSSLNSGLYRGMDFQRTNGSKIKTWADVGKVTDPRYGVEGRGGPPALLVDLCNRRKMDLWLNIPHMADDECVRQYALLVRDNLDPSLFVWVEYSNEVWNIKDSIGENTNYCKAQGVADPECDGPNPTVKTRQFYGKRAVQIVKIFREVFAARAQEDRVRLVLSGQLGYPEQLEWTVDWIERKVGPLKDYAYAVAVATYFGSNDAFKNDPTVTVETFLAPDANGKSYLHRAADGQLAGPKATRFFNLAKSRGVKPCAYEWSDGFVTKAAPGVSTAVNTDPRIQDVFEYYCRLWAAQGGDAAMHFVAVGGWDGDSSYGAVRAIDQWTPKAAGLANSSAMLPHEFAVPPDPKLVLARTQVEAAQTENLRLNQLTAELNAKLAKKTEAVNKAKDAVKSASEALQESD